MGEVVALRTVTAPAGTFTTIDEFPAPGDLSVVLGRIEWPEAASEWVIAIRAPGAPDMGIARGPWPEGDVTDESNVASLYIRLAQATLEIARTRVPALTAGSEMSAIDGVA